MTHKKLSISWLAGFVDGDGSFSFTINKQGKTAPVWNATFSISASNYNLQLLHNIKAMLGVGSINTKAGLDCAAFRVRDSSGCAKIRSVFMKTQFYTKKQYDFQLWCRALDIMQDKSINMVEKHNALSLLSAERYKLYLCSCGDQMVAGSHSKPSKDWVVGFIEAQGSFFITRKGFRVVGDKRQERWAHSFGLTQKQDKCILEFIRKKLHIKAQVVLTGKGFYRLETTAKKSLERIKDYFHNCLLGAKSLEYRIWARTLKHSHDPEKLVQIQVALRSLRKKRYKTQNTTNPE